MSNSTWELVIVSVCYHDNLNGNKALPYITSSTTHTVKNNIL